MRRLAFLAAAGAVSLAFAFTSFDAGAQPATATPLESCARPIGDLERFVADLNKLTGGTTPTGAAAKYGSLGECLDAKSAARQVSSLGARKRKELTGKLVTALSDPALAGPAGAQTRANAIALLTELARKGLEAGNGNSPYYFDALVEAAQNEKDPLLRRQAALNIDRLPLNAAQKARAQGLIDEFLPKDPPYQTIFGADGSKTDVNVLIHAGDDTFAHGGWESVARQRGATIKKVPPGQSLEITYKVTPDDPTGRLQPVTYHIKVVDDAGGFSSLRAFENMDDASIPIEAYSYHSQYGRALRESHANAPAASTLNKVFLLGSCKGQVFRSRTARLFPNANIISTIDSEYFVDMSRSQMEMLEQFANRASWDQIRRQMDYSGAGLLHSDNYQFPDDRRQLEYEDTDGDGIPDSRDSVFNYGLENPPASMRDWEPKQPVADAACRLSGDRISFTVPVANGIIGYSSLLGSLEGKFIPDGYGTYDAAGPVFTFEKAKNAAGADVWKMRLNPAFSHLDDNAMTAAALAEMTLKGRGAEHPDGQPTYEDPLAAFAAGAEVLSTWNANGAWEGFQKRYGFEKKLSLYSATEKIDHDNGVTSTTISDLKEKLKPTG